MVDKVSTRNAQASMQGATNDTSQGAVNSLKQGAQNTLAEGQAAVEARLAGHAVAAQGKALDAMDKALI
jgi:hypothetical protein